MSLTSVVCNVSIKVEFGRLCQIKPVSGIRAQHHGGDSRAGGNKPSTFTSTLAPGVVTAVVESRAAASISARDGPEASGSVESMLSSCLNDGLRGKVGLTNYPSKLGLD